MPDYKEMYLKMFRAAERAENILIKAQRECENMYIEEPTQVVALHPKESEKK